MARLARSEIFDPTVTSVVSLRLAHEVLSV